MKYVQLDNSIAMDITMDICGILMENGADIARVESSVRELCEAFHIKQVETLVIPTFITITYMDKGNMKQTASRRFDESGTNLSKIEGACSLISQIKKGDIEVNSICSKIHKLKNDEKSSMWKRIAIYIGVASIFTLIFLGANIVDLNAAEIGMHILSAAVCAVVIYGVDILLAKANISDIFAKMLLAVMTVLSLAMFNRIIDLTGDPTFYPICILMGNIMLIVPGIKFTNGIRDLFSGDVASATIHVVGAVFGTIGIVLGVLLMQSVLSYNMDNNMEVHKLIEASGKYIAYSTLITGLGTMCFAMYFRINTKHILLSFFAGAMTWLVYVGTARLLGSLEAGAQTTELFSFPLNICNIEGITVATHNQGTSINSRIMYADVFLPHFCASLFATIVSESIAHHKKIPSMIFLFPAIVSLIPGGSLYKSLDNMLNLNSSYQSSTMMETLYAAGGISCGIIAVAAIGRVWLALIDIIDSKSADDAEWRKQYAECKKLKVEADYWYAMATKQRKRNPKMAYYFYMSTEEKFNDAIKIVREKEETWHKKEARMVYDIFLNAGINYFWLYRCELDVGSKLDNSKYLKSAMDMYEEAEKALNRVMFTDDDKSRGKMQCQLYNWMAVMNINLARYETNDAEWAEHLAKADKLLKEANRCDFSYTRVYLNMTETAFARAAKMLGIDYNEPISSARQMQHVEQAELEQQFELMEVNLRKALTCNPQMANLKYKMAQMYTYRILYRVRYCGDSISSLGDLKKNAEEWLAKAEQTSARDLGYLYIYREYLELVEPGRAKIVNEVIRELDANKAEAWEKRLA